MNGRFFYKKEDNIVKLKMNGLKTKGFTEKEFRSKLAKTLGYQAFVVKVDSHKVHSILISDEVKINSQGLIITKSKDKMIAYSEDSGSHLIVLKQKKSDYAIFESVMNKEEPIKEGSKILLKSN